MNKIERSMSGAMITNYFTLRALAVELHGFLPGYSIAEIFSQKKNELILALHNSARNERLLLISIDPLFHYMYALDRNVRAKKNSVDLFPSVIGEDITGIGISPDDRVITISLSNTTSMVLHLFGTTASNIYLLDNNRTILESFKRNDELQGTILPENSRHVDQSLIHNENEFIQSILQHSKKPAVAALKQVLPMLGPIYTGEICFRSGIEQLAPVDSLSPDSLRRLHGELVSLIDSLEHPRPVYYEGVGGETVFSLVPLKIFSEYPHQTFSSVMEVMAAVVNSTRRHRETEDERTTLLAGLRREHEHLQRSRTAAETEATREERADDYELYGKLILGNLHNLRKGEQYAEIPDMYGSGSVIRIKLDPKLSPALNAEHYFQLAKSTRVKQSEAAKRVRGLQHREAALATIIEKIQNSSSPDELKEIIRFYRKDLKAMNLVRLEKAETPPPFRVFNVSGDMEVWVGKNSANNDLLTMKYSKPHDLWFHARGASGSHTVLRVKKNKPVPKEAIRQAAEIAAYYSKMRNASTVPVAYCERKYVRKPRGLAPGTVVLDREELIFVQPGLP